jgi:pimeloyl-ACP methyl ester carboxylesterase
VVPTPSGVPFDLAAFPGARARTVAVGGDALFVVEQGQGPAVVFLHGYSCDLGHFLGLMAPLAAAGFRAVLVDLPGHGRSSRGPGPYGPERFVAAALGVLDGLGLERAHLVGHSMGAALTLAVLARAPARVDRVLLIGPYLPGLPLGLAFGAWMHGLSQVPGLRQLFFRLNQWRPVYDASLDTAVHVRTAIDADGGAFRRAGFALLTVPGTREALVDVASHFAAGWKALLPALPRLGERGRVLWGERDAVARAAGADAARAALGCPVEVWPDVGHCVHLEAPERTLSVLLSLLRPDPAPAIS